MEEEERIKSGGINLNKSTGGEKDWGKPQFTVGLFTNFGLWGSSWWMMQMLLDTCTSNVLH